MRFGRLQMLAISCCAGVTRISREGLRVCRLRAGGRRIRTLGPARGCGSLSVGNLPRYRGRPCRLHGHRRPYGKWAELSGRESNTTMHHLMGRLPRLSAICSAQLAIPSTPRPNCFGGLGCRPTFFLGANRSVNARRRSGNRVPPEGFDSWKNCGTCGTIAAMRKTRSPNNTEASLLR
jgi:hypothetical protein